MCAIAGVLGSRVSADVAEKMLATMERRGPDGKGIYQADDCLLLHTRLAVIDVAGGGQPMHLRRGKKTYTIVYNGELYNTAQLRRELAAEGCGFVTRSDTEVVLAAFVYWGEACLERFNGIYAFGIWEQESRKLFLARDRIGVKPLFYTVTGQTLAFASEIKTLFCCPGVKPRLDAHGAAEVLMLGPGRSPGSGVFRDVFELEPGCCGWFEDGCLRIRRYWKLLDREHRENFEETSEHVRCLVTDAIRRQTVSDVPWGTFLSGGLDSSLISGVCAGAMAEEGKRLPTFSVDYVGNDRNFRPTKFQPNSDRHYIELMHQKLLSRHTDVYLDSQQLLDGLEGATIARDLPGMADVDFSLLLFCREMRRDVTVALSGECADEIFGGYPWYRDPEVRAVDGFPWAQSTAWRKSFLAPWISREMDGEELVRSKYRMTLEESDILPENSPLEKRMKQMVNLNFRWFMQTLLDRKDRMSMFSGLEVRVPFCDHRIAEYLYGVPWEFKDYQGKEKGLLRHAMAGYLPQEVLWRKKSPYPKTFDPTYLALVQQRLRGLLGEKNAPIFWIVRREALENLLQTQPKWPWYGQLMNIPQTIAYMLQINFWLEHYQIEIVG